MCMHKYICLFPLVLLLELSIGVFCNVLDRPKYPIGIEKEYNVNKKYEAVPAEHAITILTLEGNVLGNQTKSIAFSLLCKEDKPSRIRTSF